MENEDELAKTEEAGIEGSAEQRNHGFAIHSSGTLDQNDLISEASNNSEEDLPPNMDGTEGEG